MVVELAAISLFENDGTGLRTNESDGFVENAFEKIIEIQRKVHLLLDLIQDVQLATMSLQFLVCTLQLHLLFPDLTIQFGVFEEDGSLWVCDEGVGRVYHIDGDLDADIENPDSSSFAQSLDGFLFPAHVAVEDSTGFAWIADRESGSLHRFAPDFSDSIRVDGLQEPSLLAPQGTEGLCWALERGPEPTLIRAFFNQVQVEVTGFSDPRGLAASPHAGEVWVSDAGLNSVLLFDAMGQEKLRVYGFDQPSVIRVNN